MNDNLYAHVPLSRSIFRFHEDHQEWYELPPLDNKCLSIEYIVHDWSATTSTSSTSSNKHITVIGKGAKSSKRMHARFDINTGEFLMQPSWSLPPWKLLNTSMSTNDEWLIFLGWRHHDQEPNNIANENRTSMIRVKDLQNSKLWRWWPPIPTSNAHFIFISACNASADHSSSLF
jgi:hypothetical protein